MPKGFDFEGSGYKGMEFELKGYQERNTQNLLGILGSKETQKTVTELAKIKPEQWKEMGTVVESMKSFLGIGTGTNLDILGGIGDSLKDMFQTEINAALAPLKNEIIGGINTALEPVMPYIEEGVNQIATLFGTGISFIETLFTGRWDEFMARLDSQWGQARQDMWDAIHQWQSELYAAVYEGRLTDLTGYTYEELNQSGTAGGVYSGQFDIDFEYINNMTFDLEGYD